MKHISLLFIMLFSFSFLNAQEVYHFRTDAPQGIRIESSTSTGLALHYTISEIGITDVKQGAYRGQEITLKGSFGSTAEGLPNLPFDASRTFDGIDLLPVAELQMNGEAGAPAIRKDMDVFGKDAGNFSAWSSSKYEILS